jgi:hypothetical protein
MTDDDLKMDKDLSMEEYKALRSEGLRSAGIIANTVWLGTTQFALTIIGAATYAQKVLFNPIMLPIFLILLCLESIAATFMFLSDFEKYVRVGRYIREEIETKYPVMHWEHWIQSKRSVVFPIISIIILQLPFLASIVFLLGWRLDIDNQSRLEIDNHLNHDFQSLLIAVDWRSVLVLLIITDLLTVLHLLLKIRQESQPIYAVQSSCESLLVAVTRTSTLIILIVTISTIVLCLLDR